jgi:hypothetical protein
MARPRATRGVRRLTRRGLRSRSDGREPFFANPGWKGDDLVLWFSSFVIRRRSLVIRFTSLGCGFEFPRPRFEEFGDRRDESRVRFDPRRVSNVDCCIRSGECGEIIDERVSTFEESGDIR